MSVLSLPVVQSLLALMVRIDPLFTGLPFGRTHLAVFVTVLEGLHQSQDLIYIPADGCVIELHVSQDAFVIYDKRGPQMDGLILRQAPIVFP